MVEEEMEGNVVMVTLGAEGGMQTVDEEQGTSFMELKPSTTLLVPMELMEGHEALVGCPPLGPPELHHTAAPEDPPAEAHTDFTLMLDVDDEVKDAEMPPLNDDLEFSVPPTLSPAVDDDDDDDDAGPVTNLELILLEKEALDVPVLGEACEQEQGEEVASTVRADEEGSLADDLNAPILNTDANLEPEDVTTLLGAALAGEDDEGPAGLLMPEASPRQELPEDVAESAAVEEEVRLDDEHPESEVHEKEPEENGPVDTEAEATAIREAEPAAAAAAEKNDLKASETEEDGEEMKSDTETQKDLVGRQMIQKDIKEDEAASDGQAVEEPVEETAASQGEKSVPSNPTRRTTRGKSVTFISPHTEEKEEQQEEDGKLAEAQSNVVPVSLQRTPRRSKRIEKAAVTPRRSSRRAQQQPPEEEEEEPAEAPNQAPTVSAASKSSSPARRRVSTRSSQSASPESSATEPGGSEDDVADAKPSRRSSSKTPTTKHRTPQSSTPRRSNRKILGSVDVVPAPLEMVKEENEQEEVFTSVKHTSKRTKAEAAEELPVLEEEEEEQRKARASSPGRTTRHSSRTSLTVDSQVRTQIEKNLFINFTALDRLVFSAISCVTSSEYQEDEKTHC